MALVPVLLVGSAEASRAMTDGEVERIVVQSIESMISPNEAGGAAVAVRIEGRTLFFNYGFAARCSKW